MHVKALHPAHRLQIWSEKKKNRFLPSRLNSKWVVILRGLPHVQYTLFVFLEGVALYETTRAETRFLQQDRVTAEDTFRNRRRPGAIYGSSGGGGIGVDSLPAEYLSACGGGVGADMS